MKLADLRKLSVKQQLRIRFQLPNGMECVVNETGVALIPALKGIPDFNLETELASVSQFVLEAAKEPDKKNPVKPRSLSAAELAAMTSSGSAAHAADEEE